MEVKTICFIYIDVKNISAVVPDLVRFECDTLEMPSVFLRKDNITVVHVKIENSSVFINNPDFKATLFNDNQILFKLIRSEVKDEGKYSCVVPNKTTEIIGNGYILKVFSK